jgi:hypothetical protein
MEGMKDFVNLSRNKDLAFIAFPILAFKLIPRTIVNWNFGGAMRRAVPNSHGIKVRKTLFILPLWYLWSQFNPWVRSYREEKESLLNRCYVLYGNALRIENTILPRWWTESYVNYLIRRKYVRRWWGSEYKEDIPYFNNDVGSDFRVVEAPAGDDDDDDDDDEDDD